MTLRLAHERGRALAVLDDESPLLTYRYDGDRFPYCHPVHLPGGPPITLAHPHDHPWHLGLYFAWKYLAGRNVWEGPDQGEPHGSARHVALTPVEGPGGVGLRHLLVWAASEGAPLLNEERAILVRPPDPGGFYCIDWSAAFTPAAGPVVLERKVEWGGYAGLSARLPRSFLRPRLLNAAGQTEPAETHRARAAWTDYSGWVDGEERPAWGGVAMIDHPQNPRHPTPWLTYNAPDLQFLNAAFLRDEPLTLAAGETLRLAYRAVVHWGAGDAALLDGLAEEFAGCRL